MYKYSISYIQLIIRTSSAFLFLSQDAFVYQVFNISQCHNQYEIKSAKAFTKSFTTNLDYLKNLLPDEIISTQIIYDGELDILSTENGMMNFRNILK